MTNLNIACSKTKSNFATINTYKFVKGSKLTYVVDLEVAVHICIMVNMGKETRRLQIK